MISSGPISHLILSLLLFFPINFCHPTSLKIGIVNGSAGISCLAGETCHFQNYLVDTTNTLCDALQLACTFTLHNDAAYGDVDESGNSTGMVALIQNGHFDTSLPIFTPTYRRLKAIDFSDAYFYTDIILVTRPPIQKNGSAMLSIVDAFEWRVWCAFAGTLTISVIFIALVKLKLKTLQFESIRLTVTCWLFGLIVLGSAYTGVLFSETVVPQNNLPFKDLESFVTCLEENRCRMIQPTLSLSYLQYLTAEESELGRRIQATWKEKPVVLESTLDIPQSILDEKKLNLVWITSKFGFDQMTKNNKDCKFYTVDTPCKEIWAFPMRKNSSLLPKINQLALLFQENGITQSLQSKYVGIETCDQKVQVNLSDFESSNAAIFYIYCLCVFVAVIILGAEIGFYKYKPKTAI